MRRIFLQAVAALMFMVASASVGAIDDPLPPEQAFKLSARVLDAANVEVRFDIAKGYYLYRKQFHFLSDTPDVTLGEPLIPAGKMKQDETLIWLKPTAEC